MRNGEKKMLDKLYYVLLEISQQLKRIANELEDSNKMVKDLTNETKK